MTESPWNLQLVPFSIAIAGPSVAYLFTTESTPDLTGVSPMERMVMIAMLEQAAATLKESQ